MNSNINEVTQSIGEKERTVTANLDEIRELLKQLKQTDNNININTTIQNEDIPVQEGTLENTEEDFIFNEGNAGVVNDLKLEIPKSDNFDSSKPYTQDDIKLYHDVASNLTTSKDMSIQDKYNIIKNVEKRLEYLINIKETNSDEFQKLNEMYDKCKNNKYCQGIINEWNDIEERHSPRTYNISQQSTARSIPTTTPTITPRLSPEQLIEKADKDIIKSRYNFLLAHPDEKKIHLDEFNNLKNKVGSFVKNEVQSIEGRPNNRVVLPPITKTKKKGGKKRRSTMKRGKQNKKSQKKSKSHKKRH
jgi:hypothetical protein